MYNTLFTHGTSANKFACGAQLNKFAKKSAPGAFYLGKFGRGDRIRTYDPLVPNQMRYQTALLPDRCNHCSS